MTEDLYSGENGDTGTVFRDVIMLALAGFVAIVILLLPHLNPPGQEEELDEREPPPGTVSVEVSWPEGWNTDVDLWVQAPGDVPVGYSNKGGLIFNLLRDDLGTRADPHEINYETAFARGRPPGEYTVNLHLYRNAEGKLPVPYTVTVTARDEDQVKTAELEKEGTLLREGEERTVFRFTLDAEGEVTNVTTLHRPIRSAGGPN